MTDTESGLRIFVLMPFETDLNTVYDQLIKEPLESRGHRVGRADSIVEQRNILKDVIRGIAGADLVVADLTGLNPNVFYELGIAHALNKPSVVITQTIADIPFDLRSYRVEPYSVRFDEAQKLSEKLIDICQRHSVGGLKFENPVSDFGTPPISVTKQPSSMPAPALSEKGNGADSKGFLDFVAEGLDSLQQIAISSQALTAHMVKIGERTQGRTQELEELKRNGGPLAFLRIRDLVKAEALDLLDFAKGTAEEEPKLRDAWYAASENIPGWLQLVTVTKGADETASRELLAQIRTLQEATGQGLKGIKSFRVAVEGKRGISRDLNRAIDTTLHVLDKLLTDFELADSACSRIVTILDEKLLHPVEHNISSESPESQDVTSPPGGQA